MSNCYTHTCFAIRVTTEEAFLIKTAFDFSNEANSKSIATINESWLQQPEPLRKLFPAINTEHASGFLAIFSDIDDLDFRLSLTYADNDDGSATITGTSSEFDPAPIANLFARCITTSLPIGVTWCDDSDKDFDGAYGGGGFHINQNGIHWVSSYTVHEDAKFETKLVLCTCSPNEHPQFWNEKNGFGELKDATIFSESQAETLDLPIALDQPEWHQLPC